MKGTQVNIVPFTCNLSNLTVFTTDSDAAYSDTILRQDEPFSLRVTVEFGGPGAIALMPLLLSIKVNFFATPYCPDPKVELGHATVTTIAGVFTYTPTLSVARPTKVGLVSEQIYHIGALLRAGAPDWPALVTGFIEGLSIQIYNLPPPLGQ